MTAPASIEEAWHICGDLFRRATEIRPSRTPDDVHQELLFCLLGGYGVTYEHNRSAAEVVGRLKPFADSWDEHDLFEAVSAELSLAQFEPRRRDGSLRRYRFPQRKTTIIVRARRWTRLSAPLAEILDGFVDGRERRRFLSDCPGIGPKTASWFLRNLGWGEQLAIIDVHLLRALSDAGRVSENVRMPRDYDAVEDAFLNWCRDLNAPPAAFDLFVWEWQRGTLQPT